MIKSSHFGEIKGGLRESIRSGNLFFTNILTDKNYCVKSLHMNCVNNASSSTRKVSNSEPVIFGYLYI